MLCSGLTTGRRVARVTKNRVALVGAFATEQGEFPGKTAWDLGVDAFRGALDSSGIDRSRIDGLITQMGQDGSGQMEPTRFGQIVGLNPAVSGALHYGTAGFSIPYAAGLIASGQCELVALVYATNQRTGGFTFGEPLDAYGAPYGYLNPAGPAAIGFQRYLHQHGLEGERDKLGAYALTMRANAARNPIAYRRDPMTWADYLSDRWIIWPLRRSDICLITDGGVCLLLASAALAAELTSNPVTVLGIGRQDALRMMENDDHLLMPHMRASAKRLYEACGVGPSEVDALYILDGHAAVIPATLEHYGFCKPGEGLEFLQGGRIAPDGELPLNTNGGQMSEGYMVGWLHQVEIFRQLRGEAGERQVTNCRRAQFCATGGLREFTSSIMYGVGDG